MTISYQSEKREIQVYNNFGEQVCNGTFHALGMNENESGCIVEHKDYTGGFEKTLLSFFSFRKFSFRFIEEFVNEKDG